MLPRALTESYLIPVTWRSIVNPPQVGQPEVEGLAELEMID